MKIVLSICLYVKFVKSNTPVKRLINFDYVGTTTEKVTEKQAIRGEEVKQKFIHEHFLRDDHQGFLQDLSITLIDKTQPSDPNKTEYYWIRTLKTLYPNRLKRRPINLFI